MAIVELDPLFIRALRLLHSKSKESDVQLKALLDECIRQRKAGLPINIPPPPISSGEKNLDRLKRDLSQFVPGSSGGGSIGASSKRSRLDVKSSSMTPSPTASIAVEDAEDMDIDFQSLNDCTCCICKSFNQENGNKLMECHTCQNLYHQECHNPIITDEEVADPRLVWNCTNCSATIQQTLPSKASLPTSSSALSKPAPKPIISKGLTSSVASSGSRVGSTSANARSGSHSSSSSSSGGASNVGSSADKRLQQMMKKKAGSGGTSETSQRTKK